MNPKLILDVQPRNYMNAVDAHTRVQRQNPDQKLGTSNGIKIRVSGGDFVVIRNQGSYTVKEGS